MRLYLAAAPLVLAGCRTEGGLYFGKTDPPRRQKLVAVLGVEPGSLDPATSEELIEERVIYAFFEGLTTLHPLTGEAMAGLATHYEISPDGRRYTFYIRGHPEPRGTRLAGRDDLPLEYTRGLPAAPDSRPARWSDGVRVTAYDIVYSWRRTLNPTTAAAFAYVIYYIENAQEVNSGKLPPERLGVRALDDSTVQVDLRIPVPFFLELAASKWLCAVPRHVIQTAGKAWTEADRMVTNGAFTLRERRPGEKLVLTPNRYYYEAGSVPLEELAFLPVIDRTAGTNLYRTAAAGMTPTTPTLMPVLHRKRDFRPTPLFDAYWANVRTTQPPFDDVRVRYALNMAIDKRAIADLVPGQKPAVTLVPPVKEYLSPSARLARVGDSETDVLAFNPRAAREFLESAIGRSRPQVRYTHPPFENMKLVALTLQQQWRDTLGIELELVQLDVATWVQATFDKGYSGLVANGDASPYVDPSYFLDKFTSSGASGSDWSDTRFDAMVADAESAPNPESRLQRLAQCESHLLGAMPMAPLSTFAHPLLAKPYIKGLGSNLLDRQQFKYVWIDTNWRPS